MNPFLSLSIFLIVMAGLRGLVEGSDGYDFTGVFPAPESWHAGGAGPLITDAYESSGSSWWVRYPESDIFAYLISSRADATGAFAIRIGKGGQIFSIRVFGEEWIPPQYRSNTQDFGRYYAPWVDEVFQPVAVNRALNTDANPYFIHGAGIYLKDPPVTDAGPFYSPLLASKIDEENGRLMLANWSQNPHVPTIHRSGLILFQRLTDRGQGIIEIEYILHNAGEDLLDYFNLPWGGVRRTNLPIHYVYNPDGTRTELTGDWSDGNSMNLTSTAGYVSYASSRGEAAPSLTLVLGNRDPSLLDGRWRKSNWRWGTSGVWPTDGTAEHRWRNYFVGATQVGVNLASGESLLARFFMVIGRESTTPALVATHQLVNRAGVWKMRYTEADAVLQSVYASLEGLPLEPVLSAGADQRPWFSLSAAPIPGWRPVLVLEDSDGQKLAADDFYRLAHPGGAPSTGFWRSYNGRTASWRLLGFAAPDASRLAQTSALPAASVAGVLGTASTIGADFTTEMHVAFEPQLSASLSLRREGTRIELEHALPVDQAYSIQVSNDLLRWEPFTGRLTGTHSSTRIPLDLGPQASPSPAFFRLRAFEP